MKKNITISIDIFDDNKDIPAQTQELISKAKEAAEKAYAPHSGFKVGAALLLANGKIITGNNQENAAYPSGLCAERVALFYARSQYPDVEVKELTVVALKDGETANYPVTPCGACRQVFTEYETKQGTPMKIVMAAEKQTIRVNSASDLLPLSFGDKDME